MHWKPISRFAHRAAICTGIVLVLILAFHFPASAQDLARRLILKDGSFQLVAKYEVKGDRVRYMSAERNEWEELPSSLVDWPATEKYEKDRTAGASVPEAVELDKEVAANEAAEEAKLPQVAPGLRLPEDSGVFLLDSYKGEPQIVELQQTAGDVNRNTKGNILRGALNPIASARQTIVLEGEHAALFSHADVPSIYISIDQGADGASNSAKTMPQEPQQREQARVPFDRFRILRMQSKGGKRILGDVKRTVNGRVSEEQHFEKTTITRVAGGWFKVTPSASLAAGEYALVEMQGTDGMNLYVWDFGVDPKAPPNPNVWKPEPKEMPKVTPADPQQ